ncbi:uncharacterized protein [Taeniopygia guttata]|uniref:uncharacterized protein n=1 Tax=Taeniopygia guttata TaxID=59729 RepID=UPI003BB9A676
MALIKTISYDEFSRRGLSAAAPDSYRESAEGKVSERPATEQAKPASNRGHPQPFEGSRTDFPGHGRPLPPFRGGGRDRLCPRPLPCCARLRRRLSAPTPAPPDPDPRHTPATGERSAPPPRRAALPGASDSCFMSGERDAGPAAASSPCPACCAPPGSGGSCGTPGARQRLRCAPPRTQAVLPPGMSAAPDRTPHRSPGALPGASAAAGRSRRCPGEERTGCPRSAPRRPGLPPLRPAPAPLRPRSSPPQPPVRLRRPGGLCPALLAGPARLRPLDARAGGRARGSPVPGAQPKTRLPLKIASKLPVRGDGTAGCS